MSRLIILCILCTFMLSSLAAAADLYLLSINSNEELSDAKIIIPNAHGLMDGRFIVKLDAVQLEALERAGLGTEPIGKNLFLANTYLVHMVNPQMARTALSFAPKYSSRGTHLIEISSSGVDVIRKEGYMTINLSDLNTPLFYNPPTIPAGFRENYPSDTLADLVNQDSLYAWDTRLEAFQSRMIYSDSINAARDWIVSMFQSWGYTNVTTELFYYNGYPCYNVKCVKMGTTEPDNLVVIGGHYDSINYEQPDNGVVFAPGADDNASGTTAVLELARVLKDVDTKKSYQFCAFSAEEVGLVGSYYMAQDLYNDPTTNVEVMINYDMVGFTADEYDSFDVYGGANPVYAYAIMDAAERVTALIPEYRGDYGNSDHASFENFGFTVGSVAEGDFNTLGWHTNLDLSSRLDFEYLTEIVRTGVAVLGHIDNSTGLTPIEHVWDAGDGQSLRIEWSNCNPEYTYHLIYGTESGIFTDTIIITSVPPCYYDLDGLILGQSYYFSMIAINDEGYGPLTLMESSGIPYIFPRPPQGVAIEPDLNLISLSWDQNVELDLHHYKLLRRPEGGSWSVLVGEMYDTFYDDYSAIGHQTYEYMILAVDNDSFESDSSLVVNAMAATFDWPLLFVEETSSSGGLNPSEANQAAMYDSLLFKGMPYDKYQADQGDILIERKLLGQYKSIIWLDDDVATHNFAGNDDSVSWFLDYNTNLCLAGWQTIYWIAGEDPLFSGDFVYDKFGISQVTDNIAFDFVGAFGQDGWPNLETDTDNPFSGFMPNMAKFAALPGAQVIYRFNSSSDDPQFENQPCGVLYDTGDGINIALGFPVYHLTDATATALMDKIFATFGIEEVIIHGDANYDGTINLNDITFLIAYLYQGGEPPSVLNYGDPNGDCDVNLTDITYLIAYLYQSGPQPVTGCVE